MLVAIQRMSDGPTAVVPVAIAHGAHGITSRAPILHAIDILELISGGIIVIIWLASVQLLYKSVLSSYIEQEGSQSEPFHVLKVDAA